MRSASSAELYRPAFPPDEGQHTCAPVPSASSSVRFEIGDRVLISGSDEEGVITGVRYGERVYDNAPVAGSKSCCLSRFGPRSDEIESRSKWRISLAAKIDKMRGALVS
jgi:hypothetical protein